MTTFDASLQARFAAMAQIAGFRRPGYFPVMARTAILSLADLIHRDVIAARLRLEAKVYVADGALEPHSVKPMRKYNWRHPFPLGLLVDDDVAVLRPNNSCGKR